MYEHPHCMNKTLMENNCDSCCGCISTNYYNKCVSYLCSWLKHITINVLFQLKYTT